MNPSAPVNGGAALRTEATRKVAPGRIFDATASVILCQRAGVESVLPSIRLRASTAMLCSNASAVRIDQRRLLFGGWPVVIVTGYRLFILDDDLRVLCLRTQARDGYTDLPIS